MMILRREPSASYIASSSRRRLRSSVHFRSVPEWRTRRASSTRSPRIAIFLVQLGERAGGGRSVHHAVFSLLAFVAGQLVQIVFGDLDGAPEQIGQPTLQR